ncbi:MAG TPA: F0F1 ATP synthase subunit delta, partial [Acidobacteria bacterium]|nr:F0F1 ATP synthase subunit delta [Acidobacteriota bacterium]
MAERAIGISGLAARYAKALFELAKEKTEIDSTEEDLIALGAMLDGSSELNRLILSPVMSRV